MRLNIRYVGSIAIFLVVFILLIILFVSIPLVSAAWRYGSLHQHTGYSTQWGYDRIPLTSDDCTPWALEGNVLGYTVMELKEQTLDQNIDWLSFTDHSYCLDGSEFNTIRTDCQNIQTAAFTCLWGEEVSAYEIVDDIETALGCDTTGITDNGEAHLGAHGIDSYISQSPVETHCPDNPSVISSINEVSSQDGISIINHPYNTLLGIEFLDFESINAVSGYTGIEIWNGEWDSTDQEARNNWVWNKLQENERVFAYGGTDSHSGISEANSNFVKVDNFNHAGLEDALKDGTSIVTNNGYIVMRAKTNTQTSWTDMGGELDAYTNELLTVKIEHDVVNACELKVRYSKIGSGIEYIDTRSILGFGVFSVEYALTETGRYYFRAECINGDGNYRVYTNPIWVNVQYAPEDEVCYDGIDNDNDGYTDCADGDCIQGAKSQNGFCCGSGCSTNGGTCSDASTSGFTCKDGNCNSYGEGCQNGELESDLVCSGTSLSCSGWDCEVQFGAPSYCDEINPGGSACGTVGSYNELACELTGTDCYTEAEHSCNAPSACDEKDGNDCSDNSGFQCEWHGSYDDNVVEECEATNCGAISQCDEKDPGYKYAGCTGGGQTYFADKCTSSCQGEDRGDNICRSSAFATGCIADSQCNGVVAGTGDCDASCSFVAPNDTYKFYIKDGSNNPVAWLGSEGNIVLEGSCFVGDCSSPGDNSLIIRNESKNYIAYINSTGDLCISSGDCSDESASCSNPTDALAVRNETKDVVSYLNGSLCLIGKLYEGVEI